MQLEDFGLRKHLLFILAITDVFSCLLLFLFFLFLQELGIFRQANEATLQLLDGWLVVALHSSAAWRPGCVLEKVAVEVHRSSRGEEDYGLLLTHPGQDRSKEGCEPLLPWNYAVPLCQGGWGQEVQLLTHGHRAGLSDFFLRMCLCIRPEGFRVEAEISKP